MQFARIVIGQNLPIFEKKGPFGAFRDHFSNSTKHVLQKLFRGKFGGKITRISRLGCVFPGEGKSCLVYILKTSGQACVQNFYSSAKLLFDTNLITQVANIRNHVAFSYKPSTNSTYSDFLTFHILFCYSGMFGQAATGPSLSDWVINRGGSFCLIANPFKRVASVSCKRF